MQAMSFSAPILIPTWKFTPICRRRTCFSVQMWCLWKRRKRVFPALSTMWKAFPLLRQSGSSTPAALPGCAPAFPGVACKPVDQQKHYILSVPVALQCSYPEARAAALEIVKQFSSSQRLIYSAGEFNYQVKAGYPKEENGILLAPSKAYADPTAAFNAGKELAKCSVFLSLFPASGGCSRQLRYVQNPSL